MTLNKGMCRVVATMAFALFAMTATANRRIISLDGPGWTCDGIPVCVPHTWNAADASDGPGENTSKLRPGDSAWSSSTYCRKSVCYSKMLPRIRKGKRYFLRCDGASIIADVIVNGQKVGRHVGAFTAFGFEVSPMLNDGANRLDIIVDNRLTELSQPLSADFSVFGGLYRSVCLIETDAICIDPMSDGGDGVKVHADPKSGKVKVDISVLGGTNEVQTFTVEDYELWTPEKPTLYERDISIHQGGCFDSVRIRFAFRSVEFREDGFYLNGVKRKLRGVNRHQDMEGKGWAVSPVDEKRDIRLIKEMGADALRTAHYPQSQHVYDLCDELGLICWVEYPNVNKLVFTDVFERGMRQQIKEMIVQLRNHPSIAMWGLWNELEMDENPDGWKLDPEQTREMLVGVKDFMHSLDPSRAVVAATDKPKSRRINDVTDQLAYNRYPRWYSAQSMRELLDEMFSSDDRKILGISEYGVGASVCQHGNPTDDVAAEGSWHPEERQAYLMHENLKGLMSEKRIWGSFVWAMFDFGADCRTEGARHGINDKGLVCYDHVTRKDAFYLYQANWRSDIPVCHLVGSRMTEINTNRVTVMAFSNQGEVELVVNGKSFGAQIPDECATAMWSSVPMSNGVNQVQIRCGAYKRRAIWHCGR